MKKVLYVTGKLPYTEYNIDGGNKTTEEFIRLLQGTYDLDVLFFTREKKKKKGIRLVHGSIIWKNISMEDFETYGANDGSKFLVRMRNAERTSVELLKLYNQYDVVIVQHVIYLFGIPYESPLWSKTVLLPMFSGISYKLSGDYVPDEYIVEERMIYNQVKTIISPSSSEKEQLVKMYDVNEDKIVVVHRVVESFSFARKNNLFPMKQINILYVASIKKQKATVKSMALVKRLKEKGYIINLYCIGNIQDDSVHCDCIEYCNDNNCLENVTFVGNCSKTELEKYFAIADFNISVSEWETFGRGIYEGMMSNIPTIVLNTVRNVVENAELGVIPIVVDDIEEMSEVIIKLSNNKTEYDREIERYKPLKNKMSMSYHAKIVEEIVDSVCKK